MHDHRVIFDLPHVIFAKPQRLPVGTARLIEPVKLDQLRLLAERPRDTPMRCRVLDEIGLTPLRDWRVALAEFIREDCR